MRIISDFRDYYDGVQGEGFDDSILYLRRAADRPRLDDETRAQVTALLPTFHWERPILALRAPDAWADDGVDRMLLCLAGRAYPFWLLAEDGVRRGASFNADFEDLAEQLGPKELKRSYLWRRSQVSFEPWRDWQARHWGAPIDPRIHFLHRAPLVIFWNDHATANPRLADYDLQKALDPFTVFQEIEMFLGGVMAEPRDPPSPMSDREKIVSHGLDLKYGFRKRPGD